MAHTNHRKGQARAERQAAIATGQNRLARRQAKMWAGSKTPYRPEPDSLAIAITHQPMPERDILPTRADWL